MGVVLAIPSPPLPPHRTDRSQAPVSGFPARHHGILVGTLAHLGVVSRCARRVQSHTSDHGEIAVGALTARRRGVGKISH